MSVQASEEGIFDCYDGEPTACYSEDLIVARKGHACEECRHPIVRGEKHHRIKYLYDGHWYEHRVCVCCEAARCKVAKLAGPGMCIQFGMLWASAEFLIEDGRITRDELNAVRVRTHKEDYP